MCALQAREDDALRLLSVAIDHMTAQGYTAKVLYHNLYVTRFIKIVLC